MTRPLRLFALVAALAAPGGCDPATNGSPNASGGLTDQDPAIVEHHLGVDALKKELAEKGEISRERAPGGARGTESSGDALIAAKVMARFRKDPEVPAMSLEVESHEGRVTLTGRVATLDQLQHALLAALRVPEARCVISKILVEPDDGSGATKGEGLGEPQR